LTSSGTIGRITLRWNSLRGALAVSLYLLLALTIEYAIVLSFLNLGLSETTPIRLSLNIPGIDITITLKVSLIFHLIPVGVVITMLASWIHLTKCIVRRPPKKAARPVERRTKRVRGRKALGERRSPTGFMNRIMVLTGLDKLSRWVVNMPFLRVTAGGAIITISVFLLSTAGLYLLLYPNSIYEAVLGFYRDNPSLLTFIYGTSESFKGLTQTLSLSEVLTSLALSFRGAVGASLSPTLTVIAGLDTLSKYLLCQNMAAWISALSSILYGRYGTR